MKEESNSFAYIPKTEIYVKGKGFIAIPDTLSSEQRSEEDEEPSLRRYSVTFRRDEYFYQAAFCTVDVEAEDEDEARDLAWDEMDSYDFESSGDMEWYDSGSTEIDDVEEID